MTTPVVVELRADGRGVVSAFRSTREEAGRLEGQIDRNTRSTRRMNRANESATARFGKFRAAAGAAIAALGVRQVARMADEMTRLNARIQLATDGQEQFEAATEAVTRIANESGRELGAVGELYVRLAQSSRDLRDNQEELELITQAVTQSMRVSGASAAESAGAIRQISQAFASGVLRGDEFNSVNEQAPRLMQALADSMEVTRGELRGMAEDGELTSDILRRALVEEAGAIADESAQIPVTLGEAWTKLTNNVTQLVGQFDSAAGSSQGFAGVIESVADRIGSAGDFIADNTLNIRLAGIAMVRGLLLAFEELRGAFVLLQSLFTEFLRTVDNTFRRLTAVTSDAIAKLIEMQTTVSGLIPGLGDVTEEAQDFAGKLREQAEEARAGIDLARSLGEVYGEVRDGVNAAKGQIRDITDAMADDAIATRNARDEVDNLAESQDAAAEATEDATKLTEEQIESRRAMNAAIADFRAELDGPAAQAIREFNKASLELERRLAAGEISGRQFVTMLELQEEQFNRTQQELAQGLQATLEELAFGTLPPVIQQMLGLADATDRVADSAGRAGALSQIGSNFARSVINGQGIQSSISSAFIGAGGQALSETIEDAFNTAFENLEFDDETLKNLSGGFALAIGQAVDGNVGQAAFTAAGNLLGEKLGSKLGEELGAFGGAIGSIIGSIIGDAIFGDSKPKFQVRGTDPNRATDAGTDRTEFGAFGQIDFAFREIEDEAQSQIVRGFLEFDSALAQAIQDADTRTRVAEQLREFGVSSRSDSESLEVLLQQRLDLALGAFSNAVQQVVRDGTTLEDQIQRLADTQSIEAAIGRIQGIGLEFEETLQVVNALQRPGESLGQAFERLRTGITGFEEVLAGLNIELVGTRESALRFVDGLTEAAGGIQELDRLFTSFTDTFLSEREALTQALDDARGRAGGLLGNLGLDESLIDDPEAFRAQFAELLPTLDPEDAAALLRAADAIGDVIDLEEQLAQAREQALEPVRELAGLIAQTQEALLRFDLNPFQNQLVDIRLEGTASAEALREAAAAAEFQGDLESELADIHELTARRIQRAIDQLTEVGRGLAEQLFGSELGRVNDEIQDLRDELNGTGGDFNNVSDAIANAREQLRDFADSLLIGNLSPLTQGDQLSEALSQLQSASASGDASAVQQLSQQVLSIARDRFASGQQFTDIFDQVQSIVRGTTPSVDQPQQVSLVSSPALEALIAEREALEEEQARREETLLGRQLAQVVADIAGASEDNFAQVAQALGFDLNELSEVLGLDTAGLETFIAGLQVDTASVADTIGTLETTLFEELKLQTEIWRDISENGLPIRFDPGAGIEPPPPANPIDPPGGGGPGPGLPGPPGGGGPFPGPILRPGEVLDGINESGERTAGSVERIGEDIVAAVGQGTEESREVVDLLRRIADTLESGGSRGSTPVVS